MGHNERDCTKRQVDLHLNCVKKEQFGPWLRAGYGAKSMGGAQDQKAVQELDNSTKVMGPMLEGEGTGLREKVIGEGETIVGTERHRGGKEIQQPDQNLVVALPEAPLSILSPEHLMSAIGNNLEVGTVKTGEEGLKEGLLPQDPMVVEENVQSLKVGNSHVTLLPAVEEHRSSNMGEGRISLSDCTNHLHDAHLAKLSGTQAIPKGQWKRQARLQGQSGIKQAQVSKEHMDTISRKRERDVDAVAQEFAMGSTEKKRKDSQQAQTLNDTEVEETSLNWSRPIR